MSATHRLLALTVALMLAPVLSAAELRGAGKGTLISGVLRRVALTDRELVIVGPGSKGPETESTVDVPEGTPIRRDAATIAFEVLKEGESVTVGTERRNGRLTATAVQAGTAPGIAAEKPQQRPNSKSQALPRVRLLLRIADRVLGEIEKKREEQP